MALNSEADLRGLKLAVDKNDVTGVRTWFESHPCAKTSLTKDTSKEVLKEIRQLLKTTGRTENGELFDTLLQNIYDPSEPLDLEDEPLFHFLLREGSISCLEKLINRGCDVNEIRKRMTPLMLLITNPFQVEKFRYLISRGADINKQGLFGGPLHHAIDKGFSLEVVKALVDLGADVNLPTTEVLNTPLFYAIFSRDTAVIEYLLETGANPRSVDCAGGTPLEEVLFRHPDLFSIFLIKNRIKNVEDRYVVRQALLKWHYIPLATIKLMLQSGMKYTREEWKGLDFLRKSASKKQLSQKLEQLDALLEQYAFSPRTLLDLSCFRIRHILSSNFHTSVNSLPIPDFLKRCIKLEHYLGPS